MSRLRQDPQSGFTLVEAAVSVVIVASMFVTSLTARSTLRAELILLKAGTTAANKIEIMQTTTRISISVNARRRCGLVEILCTSNRSEIKSRQAK